MGAMGLSVVLSIEVSHTNPGSPERDDVLAFLRGEKRGFDDRMRTEPEDFAPPTLELCSLFVAKRSGLQPRRPEILAAVATARLIGLRDSGRDILVVQSLRLHEDLGGYTPGIFRYLIAISATHIAWHETNEGRPTTVLMQTRPTDTRIRNDLRWLGARPLARTPAQLVGIDQFSVIGEQCGPMEYWEFSPSTAKMCAQAILDIQRANIMPFRTDRPNQFGGSTVRRQVSLSMKMNWLSAAAKQIKQTAAGHDAPSWVPLLDMAPAMKRKVRQSREPIDEDDGGL